jgi:hypothetical protein
MTDIPERVDLNWIARTLVSMRQDLRAVRDDIDVMAAIVRRIDNNQSAFREELRALFDLHRSLRTRVEAIESDDGPAV